MDLDLSRKNNALRLNSNTVNGRTADIAITTHGSNLYFAISACMALSGFIFLLLAFRKPRRDRLFHYITAAIVFVAAIAYFTMGSNLGFTPIGVEFPRSRSVVRGRYREIFYVRYIDWFITTPLLLIDLMLTAGMPWPKILWVVLVDWIMIVMGLVGALITSRYKWAYYAIGVAALFYILYELAWTARRHATLLGPEIKRTFYTCGVLTLLLWLLYPIAWGLCEGGNYIAPDSEAIFYSVLDFFAKIGFGALLLWGHRKIDPARLGCQMRDYDEDPAWMRGLHGFDKPEEEKYAPGSARGREQGERNGYHAPTGPPPPPMDGNYAAPPAPPPPTEGVGKKLRKNKSTVPARNGTADSSSARNEAARSANNPPPPAIEVTDMAPEDHSVPILAAGEEREKPRDREEAMRAATHGAVGGGDHAV